MITLESGNGNVTALIFCFCITGIDKQNLAPEHGYHALFVAHYRNPIVFAPVYEWRNPLANGTGL